MHKLILQIKKQLKSCPSWILDIIIFFLTPFTFIAKVKNIRERLQLRKNWKREKSYFFYLNDHFDDEIYKILDSKSYMVLTPPDYYVMGPYIIEDVVKKSVYAMSQGCIPVIIENRKTEDSILWRDFFINVSETVFGIDENTIINSDEYIYRGECPESLSYYYDKHILYSIDDETKVWNSLISRFIKLSDTLEQYIELDIKTHSINANESLAVVLRGTDYLVLKPHLHPKQPKVSDVIEKIKSTISSGKYKSIFLVTEDYNYYDELVNEFGSDFIKCVSNFDVSKKYKQKDSGYIFDVVIGVENERLQRSLQYLSPIIIASRCAGLIGGNCGATEGIVFFNTKFTDYFIFDLGDY